MHFAFILKGYIWCVEGWPRLMLAAGGDVSWHRRRPHSTFPLPPDTPLQDFCIFFRRFVNIDLCCIFGFSCVWFGFGQEYLFCRWKLNYLLFQRLTDHSNSTPQSSTYSWSRELESEINFTCWISQDFTQVTRPNWAIQFRELIRVPRGQGVGLQGPRGSKGRPSGSQGVKWQAYNY